MLFHPDYLLQLVNEKEVRLGELQAKPEKSGVDVAEVSTIRKFPHRGYGYHPSEVQFL